MSDSANHDEREPSNQEKTPPARYPHNHVKYSLLLKPAQWVDSIYTLFGSKAFKTKGAILKAFDNAAPLDECLGTKEELARVRELVASFCEGFDNNPDISSIGRFMFKCSFLECVKHRKQVLTYYHKNRAFIENHGKFRAPVIITGMNRTGTTLLQRLMSEDRNTRSPYTFELERPIPPLTAAVDPMRDPRIRRNDITLTRKLAPGFVEKLAESHLWSPTEMEESFIYLSAQNGVIQNLSALAGSAYVNEFCEAGHKRPIFRYERLFYTMLDAYRPARSHWILKSPTIALHFPTIFDEYPDVRLVVTHRNPLIVLPSCCRLWESFNIPFVNDGAFDRHRFGELQKKYVDNNLLVPLHYRNAHPEKESQIVDCMYDDLFRDPIAMVRNIYQKFDLEYTDGLENRMSAYLRNNQQGKYGRHRYSLEQYGFDAEDIYQDYEEYMVHYGFTIPETGEKRASYDWSHL